MSKVVVSLTSYHKRIHTVHKVIESLFLQEEKADEIILWLSEMDFPKRNEELPTELLTMAGKNGFQIRWVKENLKSHKKYFYVLQEYPDSIVITVDDDMYYAKSMIGTLLESYKCHPHAISARNVHRILRKDEEMATYAVWTSRGIAIGEERMDLCAIGVNGILYPPGCAKQTWFDADAIQAYAENQDDLWLKYNEVVDGVPVVYSGLEAKDIVIKETQETMLYIQNALEGGNDDCIKKLKEYDAKGQKVWMSWIDGMMTPDDYLERAEQNLKIEFQNIFDTYSDQDIYICGAGKYAKAILRVLGKIGGMEHIRSLLVSDRSCTGSIGTMKIQYIGELQQQTPFAVICGVGEQNKRELKKIFDEFALCHWTEVDMLAVLEYLRISEQNGGSDLHASANFSSPLRDKSIRNGD